MDIQTIGTCVDAFNAATEEQRLEWAKTNCTMLAGLCCPAMQYLRNYKQHVGALSGDCLDSIGNLCLGNPYAVYRLDPEFLPEKWFLDKKEACVYQCDKPIPEILKDNICEITETYAKKLLDKPEGDFELRLGKAGDICWSSTHQEFWTCETDLTELGPDDRGYRWCKVKKETWAVCDIFVKDNRYYVDMRRTCPVGQTGLVLLAEAAEYVTFGGVQFKDQTDRMEWYMQTRLFLISGSAYPGTVNPASRPAVPIRARFLNQ